MEKENKREFTDEEVLMATRCCAKEVGACAPGCPLKGYFRCAQVKVRLADMYEEKCKELEELRKENKKLGQRLTMAELRIASARMSVSAKEATENVLLLGYAAKIANLEEECKKLKEENEVLRDDLYRVGEERAKFKEENEELRTANAHLIQLRDEYREAMPKLTEANNNLNADIEAFKREICIYINKVLDKDQEIDLLKDTNKVLKEKVAMYMKRDKKSNDLIILRPNAFVRHDMYEKLHESAVTQRLTGVIVVPSWCEVIVAPGDAEIKIEGREDFYGK